MLISVKYWALFGQPKAFFIFYLLEFEINFSQSSSNRSVDMEIQLCLQ